MQRKNPILYIYSNFTIPIKPSLSAEEQKKLIEATLHGEGDDLLFIRGDMIYHTEQELDREILFFATSGDQIRLTLKIEVLSASDWQVIGYSARNHYNPSRQSVQLNSPIDLTQVSKNKCKIFDKENLADVLKTTWQEHVARNAAGTRQSIWQADNKKVVDSKVGVSSPNPK